MSAITWTEPEHGAGYHGHLERLQAPAGTAGNLVKVWSIWWADGDEPWILGCALPGVKDRVRCASVEGAKARAEAQRRMFLGWIADPEPCGKRINRDTEHDVRLTRSQIVALARLTRGGRARNLKALAKSTFVPEPGHRHANEVGAELYTELLARLLTAAGITEAELTDWRSPPRAEPGPSV